MATISLLDQLQHALGAAYTVEREIGAGGMATVFSGVENSLGRRVAIKVLQPELAAARAQVPVEVRRREQPVRAPLLHHRRLTRHIEGQPRRLTKP